MSTQLLNDSIYTAITAPLSYAIVAAAEGKSDRNRSVTFTIKNTERNTHVTFRVRRPKGFKTLLLDAMVGSDNEDGFEYVGSMNRGLWIKGKAGVSNKAATIRSAIMWSMSRVKSNSLPSGVVFHHSGDCACCGRTLTNPDSLATGIGPVCSGRLGNGSKLGNIKG